MNSAVFVYDVWDWKSGDRNYLHNDKFALLIASRYDKSVVSVVDIPRRCIKWLVLSQVKLETLIWVVICIMLAY
jgi:hypothetical protein